MTGIALFISHTTIDDLDASDVDDPRLPNGGGWRRRWADTVIPAG